METAIGAGDFKARCLKLIPVATDHKLFGCLKGSVVEEGDIIAPVGVEWDAVK